MPVSECECCGGDYRWSWTEAFDKFGFMDGHGQVETWRVKRVLAEAGYDDVIQIWGAHNVVISSIRKEGQEMVPYDNLYYEFVYDDPRTYFPAEIVELLDEKLPDAKV